jgi:DNA-damage-inducible protein J
MSQTNINIRMDEDLKKAAEILFANLGLNMSTAFNMFVRQAVRQEGIPFEVTMKTEDSAFREKVNRKLEESKEYAKQPDAVKYSKQDFFEKVRGELL